MNNNDERDYAEEAANRAIVNAKPCATTGCSNPERWHAIPEGNAMGSDAPRRCAECCDAIARHSIAPRMLVNTSQLAPWGSIPRDYRSTGEDGARRVLVLDETFGKGTVLAPWFGPFAAGVDNA